MLENKALANKKLATVYGTITFDANGQTKELTEPQKKELANLPGFKLIETKKAPAKKTTTAATKKATEKKTATKKAEPKEGK